MIRLAYDSQELELELARIQDKLADREARTVKMQDAEAKLKVQGAFWHALVKFGFVTVRCRPFHRIKIGQKLLRIHAA